jgi:hypothetical protein
MAVRLSTPARLSAELHPTRSPGQRAPEATAVAHSAFTRRRDVTHQGLSFCGGPRREIAYRLELGATRPPERLDQPDEELEAESIRLREAVGRPPSRADRDRAWVGDRLERLEDELAIRAALAGRPRRSTRG